MSLLCPDIAPDQHNLQKQTIFKSSCSIIIIEHIWNVLWFIGMSLTHLNELTSEIFSFFEVILINPFIDILP